MQNVCKKPNFSIDNARDICYNITKYIEGGIVMKALFRKAKIYENGVIKECDMVFDGTSLSPVSGELFNFDSSLIFDNTVIQF